ncbi:MAG: hypothetical protein ACRD0H_29620, partial [Actinomycetes bacterium]
MLVGAVVSWLAARGIHVQPDQSAWAVAAMTGVFSSAYYTIARVLEEKWPAVGKVLLLSKPAASLHVAGACPAAEEDYGDGWPPSMDDAPESVPPMASLPPTAAQTAGYVGPLPTQLMEPAMEAGQQNPRPAASTGTTGHLAVAAPSDRPADYHYPSGPSGSQVVYDQEADPPPPAPPTRPDMLRV